MQVLEKKKFLIIVSILGLFGIGMGYYLGLGAMPNDMNGLWGNTPESVKPFFFISMGLGYVGFGLALFFIIFRTDLFNYYPISRSLVIIYVASMLWLPYMAEMNQNPEPFTWIKVRIALLLVGLGAWFFLRRIWLLDGVEYSSWKRMATIGAGIFFFHTMIMNAILWPIFFY
ncbi:MAG: hypothetical protein V3V00_11650 [Saprospiraceae bacterium]